MPRVASLALVGLATFALTRWLDQLVLKSEPARPAIASQVELLRHVQSESRPPSPEHEQTIKSLEEKVQGLETKSRRLEEQNAKLRESASSGSVAAPASTAPVSATAAPAPATAATLGTTKQPYFIVIGFPIGIDDRNYKRRALLRELWYPEYPNIGKTVRVEFVVGLLTYQGDGHEALIINQLHDEHDRYGDMALVNAREATRDPYRGDPKCTGEKIVAWFQQVVVVHRGTRYFLKADWDTWIHTTRLEVNLRMLAAKGDEPAYFGNTLWCSYSVEDFQPCGYGFGPLQAAGARHAECPLLPRGKGAVGPFPYAAGLFWGLSYDVVRWMAGSRLVYDFVHNASNRFAPPYWVKGEDSAFGFFVHISPFKTLTPKHWGWNVVHDGWEFRSVKERGLCTQHVTNTSLVVHSMHTTEDWHLARKEFREHVPQGGSAEKAHLPFDVDGLADLCSRNPRIKNVYSKCENAGFKPSGATDMKLFDRAPLPRPLCRSEGANVPFIASKADGGTISCTGGDGPDREFTGAEA